MGWIPNGKGILTLVFCAMMAWPGWLWAKESPEAIAEVPVLVETIQVGGEPVYLVAAPVPAAEESAFVEKLADGRPDDLALLVTGPSDPALLAAKKTGKLSRIKTFIANKFQESPIWKSSVIPQGMRDRIGERLKKISEFGQKNQMGLFLAIFHSGLVASFAGYTSSSVEAGVSLFAGLFLWDMFLVAQSKKWENVMKTGGNFFRKTFSRIFSLFGRELNDSEKHLYEVSGEFSVQWFASAAASMAVLMASGLYQGLLDPIWFGLLSNYNVWDTVIFKKLKNRRIDATFVERYFLFQIVIGSVFEVANYINVPYTQTTTAAIVTTGLAYQFLGRRLERGFLSRSKIIREFRKRKNLEPPSCEQLLGSFVAGYQ